MTQTPADDQDSTLEELQSQVSSATNAAYELEQAMPLIGEALGLIHGMLGDIIRDTTPDDADEYADDLDRLSQLANMVRLHMNHI